MLFKSVLALAATAQAVTTKINVGQGNALTFTPDTVTAAVGDILEFHFVGGNHDVVQGAFNTPCTPLSPPTFASPTVAGSATQANVFRVTVNSTAPIYYYCSVGMHCANGMVAAINPSANQTVAAYKTASAGKTSKRPTGAPYGGTYGPAPA